jgi:hypothetical protein
MTPKLCRDCQGKIEHHPDIYDRCPDCIAKRGRKHQRGISLVFAPIIAPIWLAMLLTGMLWQIVVHGFNDGRDTIKRVCDAWKSELDR